MKRSRFLAISLSLALLLFVVGCETIQQHKGAAVGAGVGAATGTAAGAIFGKSAGAAVIGGLLGGLVGGVIGHYAYDQPKDGTQTAKDYNYDPSQGTVLTIENASAAPQSIHPGDTVDLGLRYALLTPSSGSQYEVTETREIRHNGELLGRPQVRVERSDGTYQSTIPLRLPSNAEPGTYEVTYVVQTPGASDTRQTTFRVL
jgi:hypothetical protein